MISSHFQTLTAACANFAQRKTSAEWSNFDASHSRIASCTFVLALQRMQCLQVNITCSHFEP